MPEYHKPDLKSGTIPPKPRSFDEAARNFDRNEKREIERNKAEGQAWEQRQSDRREAAGRQADAKEKPGPAERLSAQGRLNVAGQPNAQGQMPNGPAQKSELTPAQQQMQQKREEARAADRQQAKTPYHDKQYAELPKKQPTVER